MFLLKELVMETQFYFLNKIATENNFTIITMENDVTTFIC